MSKVNEFLGLESEPTQQKQLPRARHTRPARSNSLPSVRSVPQKIKGAGEAIWNHKVRSGAVLVLWFAAASDRVPFPDVDHKPPSPLETVTYAVDKVGDTLDGSRHAVIWLDHHVLNKGTKASTTASSPTPTTLSPNGEAAAPLTPVDEGTTLPPLSSNGSTLAPEAVPTVPQLSTATSLPPLPTETVAPAANSGEFILQSTVAGLGTISCRGTVPVTAQARENDPTTERSPLTDMAVAANQPIDKLVPAMADQLWLDVRTQLNPDVSLPNRPSIGTNYTGPSGCDIPDNLLLPE